MHLARRLSLILFVALSPAFAIAQNWPQWRGPNGTGVSEQTDLPIVWNDTRGIVWKTELPGPGASTPAIWDNAMFVTCHTEGDRLLLLRVEKSTGKIIWEQEVGTGQAVREAPKRSRQKFHQLHNLASPSPVTNGELVVVHFGNGDLAAYDFDGKQLWKRNLQEDYGPYSIWWGHANSPVLYEGMVISVCMQDSLADVNQPRAESYLVAHDLRDGHVRWKTERNTGAPAEEADSYTTPLLVEVDGKTQLIVMGGNQLDGYDPADGKLIWNMPNLVGGRTITGPTVAKNLVFATRGMRGALLAVPLGKTGELNFRDLAWTHREGTPDSSSPVAWAMLLFTVADDGIARCFDLETGKVRWKERLKGNYKASPVAAEGRIYFLNTDGLCTVISAAPRFDKLTENQLPDETLASPAISNHQIFIRGNKAIYCLGR